MESYDNRYDACSKVHTVRVTLQSGPYKGHIAYEIGGNCFGLDMLDWNPECEDQYDIELYVENDCEFRFDEDDCVRRV